MSIFNRNKHPARFVVAFYKENPDPCDPPFDTIATVELAASDVASLVKQVRALTSKRGAMKYADAWEIIERTGIEWDAFDRDAGSWEWQEKTLTSSWDEAA